MNAVTSNPVVHLELHTRDREAALAFYADLAGWLPTRLESAAGSYWSLELGCEFGGGVVECGVSRPLWLPYVEVDDVEKATKRAEQLGARVLLTPREGPSGWRSAIAAPSGGEVALWQRRTRLTNEEGTA